jgi:hypothetical protein
MREAMVVAVLGLLVSTIAQAQGFRPDPMAKAWGHRHDTWRPHNEIPGVIRKGYGRSGLLNKQLNVRPLEHD